MALASPGHYYKYKVLVPPSTSGWETRAGSSDLCSDEFSRWCWCIFKFDDHCPWAPELLVLLTKSLWHLDLLQSGTDRFPSGAANSLTIRTTSRTFLCLHHEAQHGVHGAFSKAMMNTPNTASHSKIIALNKIKNISAYQIPHAWHSHIFLFILKPISHSLLLILMFFPLLYCCTYTKIVYFHLNIWTDRNNSLFLDKRYMMKSSQSLLLNQVEICIFAKWKAKMVLYY